MSIIDTWLTDILKKYDEAVAAIDYEVGYFHMDSACKSAISLIKECSRTYNAPSVTDRYSLIKLMIEKEYTIEQIKEILSMG